MIKPIAPIGRAKTNRIIPPTILRSNKIKPKMKVIKNFFRQNKQVFPVRCRVFLIFSFISLLNYSAISLDYLFKT